MAAWRHRFGKDLVPLSPVKSQGNHIVPLLKAPNRIQRVSISAALHARNKAISSGCLLFVQTRTQDTGSYFRCAWESNTSFPF